MKKLFLTVCATWAMTGIAADNVGYVEVNDVYPLEGVTVEATRASETTPVANSTVSKEEIEQHNLGQDLPYLLLQTPSVIVSSENGLGIGSSYLRVRGSDHTRVNITFDGVPLNSAEDQAVFWANMNSFASGLENIQVQRGVGSSTNGAGAFGATVSLKSTTPSFTPSLQVNANYGSFNTYKYDVLVGTGLLHDHWVFDGRYSQTATDGWIDRTAGRLGTYTASATYFGDNYFIRYRNFGSWEQVQQAWNGVTANELQEQGRRYNPLGIYTRPDGSTGYYPTTDNYRQNHNHLLFSWSPSKYWKSALTFHYTYGYGYYDDLKADAKLYKFGLESYTDVQGNKIKTTNLIRQKGLENDFYGTIYNLTYTDNQLKATLGAGYNYYDGDHWGEVTWAQSYTPGLTQGAHYYDSRARKHDYNLYVKADYQLTETWNGYVDLQYRGIRYRMDGNMDKYYTDAHWNNIQQTLDIHKQWNFFNPKAGVTYTQKGHRLYASVAVAHREPTRNNFTDNGQFDPAPQAERLLDYEAGYTFTGKTFRIGANLYYMDYDHQLILNGNTSDIGEALTFNVPRSYRTGVELTTHWKPAHWFEWDVCATVSRNKVKNFEEVLLTYDADWNILNPTRTSMGNRDIAFSPNLTGCNSFRFFFGKMQVALASNYVGRQYLDNTQCRERSLHPYFVTNLKASYDLHPHFCQKLSLGLDVNNLFNEEYESNGGAGGEVENGEKVYWTWLFPQAGTTVMGSLRFNF